MVGLSGKPARPRSVKELSDEAAEFNFNKNIPFKFWTQAARTLFTEAINEKRNGNPEQAYMLFMRHSDLLWDYLPRHPEAKTSEGKAALKPLIQRFNRVLDELEELKPTITASYNEWKKLSASEDAVKRLQAEAQRQSRILDVGQNQDLAVDLAQQEFHRRDAARKATRQAGISEEDEQARRGAGLWDSFDVTAVTKPYMGQDDDLRSQMDAARRQLELAEDVNAIEQAHLRRTIGTNMSRADSIPTSSSVSYNYPSISKSTPYRYESQPSTLRKLEPAPLRPPKESFSLSSPAIAPPSLPAKEPFASQGAAAVSAYDSSQTLPSVPPKVTASPPPAKEERLTFSHVAKLENGKGLRSIFIPEGLRDTFLYLADGNTRRGLEMCGILCGTNVNNALFVSHLIIPRQICTSDTCETQDEDEYTEYLIAQDLMIFGWIHTHPTQTCFMSSRDLHTQAGYQQMMPESIAIVCAPNHEPSYGIFRLTDPPGLPHLINCKRQETFHQHSIDNLYTDCNKKPAGHVFESSKLDLKVYDLRLKQ
ncbi:putative stam-binding protein [Phaeoacremonium minimum UCRPA7]|uniref:Putative stam-binding protein n=1 Tax=Phaeoacremonium minimum (strain UCR-PA7) TaxID=1286976 RepID=R8BPM1_PHAM7|nr:putative stam-binding protein [Phaeoacremonium minimum UCRPA7]EOO01284.1 putative stam-binding protein [Phaeoacremonium minimum UCRPA7]